ncbi:hypothetical protein KG007_12595 [Alistipes sp. kh20]|uniref:fimbrial protein n=1 Tax=Alistipes montrealensis TaxID=2834113 RepID=UPI001BD07CE9|nr:fimbrial protein [Alistipes montrealensis]MBS4767034.1 hypothetical protein [Alistipes montrealensis]
MKKYNIFGKWVIVFLLAAGLGGCIKDNASAGDDKTVDMVLSLDTYAGSSDPNASANEVAVKSARVYIFNESGVLENPGQTSVPLTPSGEVTDGSDRLNRTWRVTVGKKDIYVLLNAGRILRSGTAIDLASYNPYSKAELDALMTDPTTFATDFPAAGSAGMLMSGKLGTTVSTATSTVSIPVERRYARIDLSLRRKAGLAGAAVIVKKTTFKNRREKAHAFAPATENTGADVIYQNTHGNVTVGASTTEYTAVTSFYTLPRTGASKAACLELAIAIDGKDYTLPVYINSGALGGNTGNDENLPLDITANKVYKIDVSLDRQSVTVAMDILEWDEEPVNGNIQGSSLIVDSVVFVRAGRETLIPVQSKADSIYAKLSDAAVTAGYSLTDADADGVLGIKITDGKTGIPVTGPAAYPVGSQYNMTVIAGNIRRNALLQVDGIPVLEVADKVVEFGYTGDTKPYRVSSYVDLGDDAGTKVPVAWTAEFSIDEGKNWTTSKPAWLTQFTDTHAGSTTPASFDAQIVAATGVVTSAPREALQAAAPESDLDLSMTKGSRNTANCYVVNASGTYTLPLVYGNALRDGDPNTAAYTSTKSGTDVLTGFVNHLGDAISEPYIYDNPGCTPADACLVWQDAEGLVQNVSLTADKQNISFEVPRETIRQGNAIVAVRDASGLIMWSWHIWVTDYVLDSDVRTVTTVYSVGYDFMPVNLGWCDGPTTVYESRRVSVRLTQAGTGQTALFTLDQPAATVVDPGNNTYYQWGRKDPMLPGIFKAGSYVADDKSCYTDSDKPGYAFNSSDLYSSDISEWIKAPYCFNTNDYMDMKYFNLWNADNTTTDVNNDTVVKTVYDPSPVGYCLPPVNAFTGTTAYGSMTSGESAYGYMFNSPYASSADYDANNGWVFYCNRMADRGIYDPAGGTIYFPAMGFRGSSGVFGSGSGRYWTGTAISTDTSGNFSFSSYQIDPRIDSNRYSGMPVRPIREQ